MPRQSVGPTADRVGLTRPADYDKLPKRFKLYILELEARLHAFERMRDAEQSTHVYLQSFGLHGESSRRYLPDDHPVTFMTNYDVYNGRPGLFAVQLTMDINKRLQLNVRAEDGLLAVRPECGNVVRLEIVR